MRKPVIASFLKRLSAESEQGQSGLHSGSDTITATCCNAVKDFPNLCLTLACGCAPKDTHQIRVGTYGTDNCVNRITCSIGLHSYHCSGSLKNRGIHVPIHDLLPMEPCRSMAKKKEIIPGLF
jgi:hypothetical protein